MEPINETNALISDTQTAREKFEQARLSRRAALRKIGMTSGIAFFGIFAVDDLARIAIKKMEDQKQTREIGETVAREFKDSGVAFAAIAADSTCQHCCNQLNLDLCGCVCGPSSAAEKCTNDAHYAFNQCYEKHCGTVGCNTNHDPCPC